MKSSKETNPGGHAASNSAPAGDQGLSGDGRVGAASAEPAGAERELVEAVPALYDLVAGASDGPVLLLFDEGRWAGAAVRTYPPGREPATGTGSLARASALK